MAEQGAAPRISLVSVTAPTLPPSGKVLVTLTPACESRIGGNP